MQPASRNLELRSQCKRKDKINRQQDRHTVISKRSATFERGTRLPFHFAPLNRKHLSNYTEGITSMLEYKYIYKTCKIL